MAQDNVSLGGRTRISPRDFIVEEVWDSHVCEIDYSFLDRLKDRFSVRFPRRRDYLHFTLVKQNLDNIQALKYIGKRVHASLKRFGIAGMKDKWAITAQRVSLWKGNAETLAHLRPKDMFLKDFEYADERITLQLSWCLGKLSLT